MDDEEEMLPDRRRHGYQELEAKLDQHAVDLERRLARFIRGALLAFALIGLLSAAALIGFGFLLKEVGSQADDIQQQRYEAIVRNCREQNKHHDDTVAEFHKLANNASKKHPEDAAKIEESVKANLSLIDSLAPKQDCFKLAAKAVSHKE